MKAGLLRPRLTEKRVLCGTLITIPSGKSYRKGADDKYNLIICIEGACRVNIKGKEIELSGGDGFLINRFMSYSISTRQERSVILLKQYSSKPESELSTD